MRVIEVSDREGAAAYAGKLFARWGHEVVKVERPGRPDLNRAQDIYLNGGKRRVTLDWGTSEGRARLDALTSGAAVMLTDVTVGEIESHGLLAGPGTPVRVALTPFGLTGPYAHYEATEATLMAMGGYTYIMGEPGRAPLTMVGQFGSYQAGTFGYIAGLASAIAGTGSAARPVVVDVSAMESLVSLHQSTFPRFVESGEARQRAGNRMDNAPNSFFPAKDSWVGVSYQQQFWFSFAQMIGQPELAEDDHPLNSNGGRVKHYEELKRITIEAFKEKHASEIFDEAQGVWRVPIGKMLEVRELLDDAHMVEREFWRPVVGDGVPAGLKTPGSPFKVEGEPYPEEHGPRPMGADTDTELSTSEAPPKLHGAVGLDAAARSVRPLAGVRVLDLTRIWSGPVGGRILGDLGAEVIKIESPTNRGPLSVPVGTRGYAHSESETQPWNKQTVFNQLQRNRKSLCVDLKQPEGRELFLKLVEQSDVVLENFSARAMSRLGLSYEVMRERNPKLIYVPMPAFGRRGPYRDYIGLGTSIEPLAAIPSLLGYPGEDPRTPGLAIPDPMSGTAAAAAVVTALERRERTGVGMEFDLSQHEGAVGYIGEYVIEQQLTGRDPERVGNGHRHIAPYGIYRAAGEDEWIQLAARSEAEWVALCGAAGRGWESDKRFASNDSRLAHRVELDEAIEAWTVGQSKFAMQEQLQAAGVPAGGVLTGPDLNSDPHLAARGYFADLVHPVTGVQRFDGSPVVFEGDRGYDSWVPTPMLGEHNHEVVVRLGLASEDEYSALVEAGVLADRPPA